MKLTKYFLVRIHNSKITKLIQSKFVFRTSDVKFIIVYLKSKDDEVGLLSTHFIQINLKNLQCQIIEDVRSISNETHKVTSSIYISFY